MKLKTAKKLPFLLFLTGIAVISTLAVFVPPTGCACTSSAEVEMLRELEAARQYPEAEARGLLGREVYLKYSRRLPGINSTALVPAGTKAKIVGIKPNVVDTGGELDTTYQLIIRVDFPTGEHTLFDCDREIFNSLYSMSPLQPQASSS